VGAALLLWGWQNHFLPYAVPMAVILEGARLVTWRWRVSDGEFNNAADLCSIILLIAVVYIFNEYGARGVFTVLAIVPLVVFPLVVVQVYSLGGYVRLSALFMSLRRLDPARHPESRQPVDLTLPYALISLVAASAGNRTPQAFMTLAALLLVWMLWTIRPRRYRARTWMALMALVLCLGYAAQRGIIWLQYRVEGYTLEIMDRYLWRFRDPDLATTAIGSIGRIKLSDRIMLRVKSDAPLQGMLLLREAAYDTYSYGVWSNRKSPFVAVDPDVTGTRWELGRERPDRSVAVSTYMSREAVVLPLPQGVTAIRDVAATEVARNAMGAVRLKIREGWFRFSADYSARAIAVDGPPTDRDLQISDSYRETFETLAARLELGGRDPAEVVTQVRRFFADGFTYSLTQRQRYPRGRYLDEFLNNTRSGHCEYFATSTVLLLRAAGVPARYVVGYGIDEYSAIERQYIGRARHAHSWTVAYLDGAWVPLDTTPAVWAALEAEESSALQPLFDLWSWISFRLARPQTAEVAEADRDYSFMLWLLPPLLLALLWRLYFKERVAGSLRGRSRPDLGTRPGRDSELYAVVAALEKLGHPRGPGETLPQWLTKHVPTPDQRLLKPALVLHARHRFDPGGLDAPARAQLAEYAAELLRRIRGDRPAVT
jgi:transglutaminase-like putative cysteine protease